MRMNIKQKLFIILSAITVSLTSSLCLADSINMPAETEHVIWDKAPIQMSLPIGQERMITFPTQVVVDVDDSGHPLTSDELKMLNNDGTLYLTANKDFTTTRLYVKEVTGTEDKTGNAIFGDTILLDITPTDNADDTPMIVVTKDTQSSIVNQQPNRQGTQQEDAVSLVSLNRFAIQELYAPKRLITTPAGIYRAPMHTSKTVHLIVNDNVIAMPLASWRADSMTVTAVLLRNMNNYKVKLTADEVLGQWSSAVFYPRVSLSKRGSKNDSTTIFVTSNNDFNDALGGA